MKTYIRSLPIIIALLYAAISLCGCCKAENVAMCVYLLAGDLEKDSNAASEDIKEMLFSDMPEGISLYVAAGGSDAWALDSITPDGVTMYRIADGQIERLREWGATMITEGETLGQVIDLSLSDSGAQRLIVIFWGHGLEGTLGIGMEGVDDTLTLCEIAASLRPYSPDIIGFDACSMASLESCWMLSDVGRLLVASVEEEAITGWPYRRIIECISADMESCAHEIADVCNARLKRSGMNDAVQVVELDTFRGRMRESLLECICNEPVPKGRVLFSTLRGSGPPCSDFLIGATTDEAIASLSMLPEIGDAYADWLNGK